MEFSVSSLVFVLAIIIAPLILKNKHRTILLCIINFILFYLMSSSVLSFVVSIFYVLIPYYYCLYFEERKIFITLYIISFIYLARYEIISFFNIPFAPIKVIGLSYILFRVIDYSLTKFKKDKDRDIFEYLAYVLCFYLLISGPVIKFKEFKKTLSVAKYPKRKEVINLINRCVNGYVKVVVVSSLLRDVVSSYYLSNNFLGWVIFGVINYAYIYINFSGYSDIVIASAKLAGFGLMENFDKPYLSCDMGEFWRRWHISLSTWLKDNVYIPLGGSRRGEPRTYLNQFIVFMISGLWHGTDMNYFLFGLLSSIGVMVSRFYRKHVKSSNYKYIEMLITFAYSCLCLAFVGNDIVGIFMGK